MEIFMKTGNVTGAVYERSIQRKLNQFDEKSKKSAVQGKDCAFFAFSPEEKNGSVSAAAARAQVSYTGEDAGRYAVCAAVNQAAAAGVFRILGVLIHILLPADAQEKSLQRLVEDAGSEALCLGTVLADVKAFVTPAVKKPVITAEAIGTASGLPQDRVTERFMAGSSIVMTKWAGLEGSAILAGHCRDRLRERYPAGLIDEAAGFIRFLPVISEAAAAVKSGAGVICAAAEGGIFRALWTLGQRAGTGLEIDLKKIPIRQETVEICNYLDVNPYELAANGSLLCVTGQSEALLSRLNGLGIPAAVIGMLTEGNDRVIRNGEERRFLEPSKEDEIYKIINKD